MHSSIEENPSIHILIRKKERNHQSRPFTKLAPSPISHRIHPTHPSTPSMPSIPITPRPRRTPTTPTPRPKPRTRRRINHALLLLNLHNPTPIRPRPTRQTLLNNNLVLPAPSAARSPISRARAAVSEPHVYYLRRRCRCSADCGGAEAPPGCEAEIEQVEQEEEAGDGAEGCADDYAWVGRVGGAAVGGGDGDGVVGDVVCCFGGVGAGFY